MSGEYQFGLKPFLYGRDLLKRMKIKGHYVNEYEVMEFLGYEVKWVDPSDFPHYTDEIGQIFEDLCAVCLPQENKVLLSSRIPPTRQRLTLFHEAGHMILPWHADFHFSVRSSDIESLTHKTIEQEAFIAGTEIMYPLEYFVEDMRSLPIGFSAIEHLATRYNGSLEATAIRYAKVSLDSVAFMVVKENNKSNNKPDTLQQKHSLQGHLFQNCPSTLQPKISNTPLQIQYCCRSAKFPKYIKPGIGIESGNMLYQCLQDKQFRQGKIPASVFGSSARFKYHAECMPYFGSFFVLLWLPNHQRELF